MTGEIGSQPAMSVRMASMRGRLLPNGRADFIRQLCLFASAYILYRLVGGLVAGHSAPAFRHANDIIGLERRLGIFVEPKIQAWAAGSHLMLVIATYIYLNAQTTLIVGALLYLYIAHNRNYYFVRNMLVVAMVIGLFGYGLYPTAPPRLLPEWGFVDFNSSVLNVKSSNPALNSFINQYAAVPSMHVAFAAMLSWSLARHVRLRAARAFWLAYPLLITFVTIITGNHFFFDIVAGLGTAGLAAAVAHRLAAIRPHAWALQPPRSSVAAT
jgi:membrane-associated phospholipid phosphatase